MDFAWEVAKTIAEAFRTAPSGVGGVPRDTGLLQDSSINALSIGRNAAIVAIGGESGALANYAPYLEFSDYVRNTKIANKHKSWVEKVIVSSVIPALTRL